MKKKIILSSLILVICTLLFAGIANAASTGKINFVAVNNSTSETAEGLEVSVYKVTDENGSLAEGFENCTIDLSNLSESNLTSLKEYALSNATPVLTETTDSEGEITFSNLTDGTYLFVQVNKTDEIEMETMLIEMPQEGESGYAYTFTVKPKISTIEEKEEVVAVTDTTLPYTGVLSWPVPVLVVVGLVIFCIAWVKVFSNSKKKVK